MSSLGIRISMDGVDVKTGTDKEMVLTSKYAMLKGTTSGTGSVSVPRDGTPEVVTIAHGLGYIPFVQASFSDPDGIYWNTTNYISAPVFSFDGTTEFSVTATADATNIYLTFVVNDLVSVIGYDTIGSLNRDLGSADDAAAVVYNTFVAAAGDVCTGISFYAKKEAANETVAVSLYTMSGGVPVTKVGTGGSVNVNSTTAQWWTVSGLNDSLTPGVEYCVAYGGWGGGLGVENTQVYYDNITDGVSYHSGTNLPSTWNEYTNGLNTFSLYATIERAPIEIDYSYNIFIDKGKL